MVRDFVLYFYPSNFCRKRSGIGRELDLLQRQLSLERRRRKHFAQETAECKVVLQDRETLLAYRS